MIGGSYYVTTLVPIAQNRGQIASILHDHLGCFAVIHKIPELVLLTVWS